MGIYVPVLVGVGVGLLFQMLGLHQIGEYLSIGIPFGWIVGSLFLRKY